MNLSAFVLEASEQEYKDAFDAHPVFVALQNGKFSRTAYLAYLRETFHLIRHTTATFCSRSGSRLRCAQRISWLVALIKLWTSTTTTCCASLISSRSGNSLPEFCVCASPGAERGDWYTQCYYLAESNPVALLGYLLTTEGIGASLRREICGCLLTSPLYGYKSNQVTFLRAHGGFDVKHFNDVKNFMDRLDADASLRDAILAVRRFTIMYYSQMLRDSLDGVAGELTTARPWASGGS